jgi:hypothetical protein
MTITRVQVIKYDDYGELWPIATIDIDKKGNSKFIGSAIDSYEALIIATKQTAMRKAQEEIDQALDTTR